MSLTTECLSPAPYPGPIHSRCHTAVYTNQRTGAVTRRRAQFVLMDLVPSTLKDVLKAVPVGTFVDARNVVAILAGVGVSFGVPPPPR